MRGAADYAHETQLSRRVTEWQQRLEPVLREQDGHPNFDIHVYGDRYITTACCTVALTAFLCLHFSA
jgi:condensin-2 complex subunit H2